MPSSSEVELSRGGGLTKEINLGVKLVQIRVDGASVELPDYAQGLSLGSFWWYLENAAQIRESGFWGIAVGGKPKNFDGEILGHLTRDEKYSEYLQFLLRHGPEKDTYGFCEGSFASCASLAADILWEEGKGLELIRESEASKDDDSEKFWRRRRLGGGLHKGLLVLRGDLELASCSGGTLYVHGDVGTIEGGEGVLYINGNISKLGNVENEAVLIVTGEIGEWTMDKGHANPVLKSKRIPSPFVFAPQNLEVNMKGSRIFYEFFQRRDYFHTDASFQAVFATPREALTGWAPEETRQKALELCKQRTRQALEVLISLSERFQDSTEIVEFWNRFFFGRQKGFESGRSDALKELPYDD